MDNTESLKNWPPPTDSQCRELSEIQGYIELLAPEKPYVVIMWEKGEHIGPGPIYGVHSSRFFRSPLAVRDLLISYADKWRKECTDDHS